MVASNSKVASEAGAEVLKRGGNAVDAAVATGFALAVTHPEAGNIGGGGYMVIHMADGRNAALDYREVAPLASTRDMYVDANGKVTSNAIEGGLSSGVPGAVAGMAEALQKYGTLPLREVMKPAIRLAAEGFIVDSALSASIDRYATLIQKFSNTSLFFANGRAIQPGERLVQQNLARTLQAIAERGPDAFYKGDIADQLVAEVKRTKGIITREDLSKYQPVWREVLRTSYRGYTLLTMPPSSSGGIAITETLNILETIPSLPAFGSTRYTHLLTSALQRAFVDRNSKLGDPAFVKVPVGTLTSKEYAKRVAAAIGDRATPTSGLQPVEGTETTHYSVADQFGNAVSTTTTINGLYGSGVYVPEAGFFMNNEMDDFAARPGTANQFGLVQGEENAIAPGKRMLSSMSPTIVLDRDGKLLLVLGARGGPRIISSVTQVILNVLDHHMTLADAMRAPRIHEQALPDSLMFETDGLADAVADSLRSIGYALSSVRNVAIVTAIMRVKGGFEGMDDPRSAGGAAGH
jgi:gamma-glutamyltranspeptidase / glutathione hydrolase